MRENEIVIDRKIRTHPQGIVFPKKNGIDTPNVPAAAFDGNDESVGM